MTKLIFLLIKFILGIIAVVLSAVGITVIFILALPIAGWNKSKFIFKRVAR
ncbi:MAG: hypothetical protein H7Z76_05680 [Methylotenera sp.]|nr:hypothetical protein [Flavobacterium sp.]